MTFYILKFAVLVDTKFEPLIPKEQKSTMVCSLADDKFFHFAVFKMK